MRKEKIIYGLYSDDEILLDAVKTIRKTGQHIEEVYSPFPIHGLDHALGLKYSRLAICSFIFGAIGFSCALLLMWYIMIYDWPMNIGGKPSFTLNENLPAFIPVTFEMTVFFAAHLMVVTFLMRCGLYPGSSTTSPDPRTTDDKFLMEIHTKDDAKSIKKIKDLMKKTGAEEINEKKQNEDTE
tara:strand:- start:1877 stop:2425 length:549 start_codon:yes stop_codon:yes gene_type:complete